MSALCFLHFKVWKTKNSNKSAFCAGSGISYLCTFIILFIVYSHNKAESVSSTFSVFAGVTEAMLFAIQ